MENKNFNNNIAILNSVNKEVNEFNRINESDLINKSNELNGANPELVKNDNLFNNRGTENNNGNDRDLVDVNASVSGGNIIENLGSDYSEVFKVIINDIYDKDRSDIGDVVMDKLDEVCFITSLSLGDIVSNKVNNESKNVAASTLFYIGYLELNDLLKNLSFRKESKDVYLVFVSWEKTISLEDDIETMVYKYFNVFEEKEYKLIVKRMSYVTFFKNINLLFEYRTEEEKLYTNILDINPIIIFRGLSWGNIVHLFKLMNMNLSGGSITRRHKISLTEYRLVIFLNFLGLLDRNKGWLVNSQKENWLTSPKYNRSKLDKNKLDSNVIQYKLINDYFNIKFSLNEIDKDISDLDSVVNKINKEIESLERSIENKEESIFSLRNQISSIRVKLVEGIRMKHKAALSGRIDKIYGEIDELDVGKANSLSRIRVLKQDLINNLNRLGKLKSRREELLKVESQQKSKLKFFIKRDTPNGNISNKSNLDSRRNYHSLIQFRSYSSLSNSKNSVKKINFNIDSPIFIELQRIISNSKLDFDTQIKIEEFLNNQGNLFLRNRLDQTLDINYYKLNPLILEYLKNSLIELENLINNYKLNIQSLLVKGKIKSILVEEEIILGLSTEEIISNLLGKFLRIISNNNLFNKNTNCTELACDLGQSLLYSYYSNEYKEYLKNGYISKDIGLTQFVEMYLSVINDLATEPVLIQIGLKLLNLLEEVKLIKSELYILDKNHKNYIYVAESHILDNIGKQFNLLDLSYKIPMIVKPKQYFRDLKTGKEILGGFLLNDKKYSMPLIIKNPELKNQSVIEDSNIIYSLVNNLSSVSYKINLPVLDFILEKGLDYDLIIDPDFKHPLEIKKASKNKLTLLEKKELESFLSRKQLESNILGLALIFKNVPEFYIPVRIDNRGRVYCMVDYLNYQGIELAKALLLFSKGEKIYKTDKQSIEYLKIFGANCYGNGIEKKSYHERVEWVNNNEENILNFRNGILIKEAESKLLFIAFCFEYTSYYNSLFDSKTFYISNFPIQLDATCNGYQHLCLLTGDEPLAGQLNLISGDKNSIPNDFYSFVALKLNDYLERKLAEKNEYKLSLENKESKSELEIKELNKVIEFIESCKRLLSLNKDRKLVKLPIMVKPYNASLYQMVNYIKEQFEVEYLNLTESTNTDKVLHQKISDINGNTTVTKLVYVDKRNKNVKLTISDLFVLTNTIEQIIYNEFPKLKEFNSYLKTIAEICSNLNITITWVLPSGLNVNQYYVDTEAIRLKPFKFKKNTYSLKIKKLNVINKPKQIRALMPNLIHSLDAASLSLIVDMYFNSISSNNPTNFFAIHDCFAVTANNIVNLIKIIKLVYIKIYSDDSYLLKFDQGIINSIKLHFGADAFNDANKTININNNIISYPDVNQIIQGRIKANKIMRAQSIIN